MITWYHPWLNLNMDALLHYKDAIMGAMATQIISIKIVFSTVYSGADQSKYQSSASLAFVRGINRWPVYSPHKGPVTRKMFVFDDVIMWNYFGTTNGGQCRALVCVFFTASLYTFLNKQSRGRWYETSGHSCALTILTKCIISHMLQTGRGNQKYFPLHEP